MTDRIYLYPDKALHLLKNIRNYQHLTPLDHALYALLIIQALDKCDYVVVSDSLITITTNYYGKNPIHASYVWFY